MGKYRPGFSWKVQLGVHGFPRESRLLSPTLCFAACSYLRRSVQLARFSLLQRRELFCGFGLRPMPLGWARDDPLVGAPALDAYLIEGERASSPMEKGADRFWAGHLWVPRNFFLCCRRLSNQGHTRLCLGFSNIADRTKRSRPTSPARILCQRQRGGPAWPHLDTSDASLCSADEKRGRHV